MSELSATRLLDLWEQGAGAPPLARALLLLSAAEPTLDATTLAGWSLGRRDATLLDLRARLFGEALQALAVCPRCAAPLELNFLTGAIRAPFADATLPPQRHTLEGRSYLVILRPISTAALMTAGTRRELLLQHCVVEARCAGEPLPVGDLPAPLLERCAAALAEADPQADVRLALTCLECGERWQAPFDPAGFLWRELEVWAERMLREVHLLATAYGWSEAEILSLSAARRRRYLELVTAY